MEHALALPVKRPLCTKGLQLLLWLPLHLDLAVHERLELALGEVLLGPELVELARDDVGRQAPASTASPPLASPPR